MWTWLTSRIITKLDLTAWWMCGGYEIHYCTFDYFPHFSSSLLKMGCWKRKFTTLKIKGCFRIVKFRQGVLKCQCVWNTWFLTRLTFLMVYTYSIDLWLTCASLLQAKFLQDAFKPCILREVGQFHMYTCPQPCAKIGWTGKDEAKVFVPHELMSWGKEQGRLSDHEVPHWAVYRERNHPKQNLWVL